MLTLEHTRTQAEARTRTYLRTNTQAHVHGHARKCTKRHTDAQIHTHVHALKLRDVGCREWLLHSTLQGLYREYTTGRWCTPSECHLPGVAKPVVFTFLVVMKENLIFKKNVHHCISCMKPSR